MESADYSSQEKLDELLDSGKITDEDYLRLSKAMEPPKELSPDKPVGIERRRFRKNWDHGVIGGLLAGYAEYFGADVGFVRTVFLIGYILLCALKGIGLVIVPLYFALCALVPWDDEEKARAFLSTGRPRLFMVAVAALFFVLPALYAMSVFPSLESTYQRMGIEVWSPSFQETLAGRAVDSISEYRNWLNFHNMMLLPVPVWAVVLPVLLTWFLGVVYSTLRREKIRRLYERIMIGLGVVWVLFLVGGTLYPLVMLMTRVR